MASTASSSTASSSSSPEQRPQAEPLPVKRGEIGYSEDLVVQTESARPISQLPALPARHPADRDAPPPVDAPSHSAPAPAPSAPSVPSASSSNSITKPSTRFRCWNRKKVPSFGGILITTFLAFLVQFVLLGGTIAAWAISVMTLNSQKDKDTKMNGSTSSIFVHVVFAIGVLGQLLFFERRIFRLRAERYAYLHPGELLPSARRRVLLDTSMEWAPWHRPPIPTYAAALAQSGVGTGDVEDHLIAQPPPPAYGNTRGSTLLLSGFLRNSLRAQRPVSEQSQRTNSARPLSYASRDEQWEEIQDAERARRLEETLATLQRPMGQQ